MVALAALGGAYAATSTEAMTAEQALKYFEALAQMQLPVGEPRTPAVASMLRAQLQCCALTPAQSVRLLAIWAALLCPDGGCTYRPTPHVLAALLPSLRPQQLSPSELETAVVARAAFPWPTWDSWRAMQQLAAEIASRWVGGPLCCWLLWVACSAARMLLLAWQGRAGQPVCCCCCHCHVADPGRRPPHLCSPLVAPCMQRVRCLPAPAAASGRGHAHAGGGRGRGCRHATLH